MFVSVIIALSLPKTYVYRVDEALAQQIGIGMLVEVPLKNKTYCGIVSQLFKHFVEDKKNNNTPNPIQFKSVISIVENRPIVAPQHIQLWQWIAKYYMCSEGAVFNIAVPASLKMSSDFLIDVDDTYEEGIENKPFSDEEHLILNFIKNTPYISIQKLENILKSKVHFKTVKKLADAGRIFFYEKTISKYTPKIEKLLKLNPIYNSISDILNLITLDTKKKECEKILLQYWKYIKTEHFLTKKKLLALTQSQEKDLNYLINKAFLISFKSITNRLQKDEKSIQIDYTLSDKQNEALNLIKQKFLSHAIVLLNGVTASGKTLLYCKLIEQYLMQGQQVLYLLPEIALTNNIVKKIAHYFKGYVFVYHSKISDNIKKEIWDLVLSGESCIILGARSAIFLPFVNLGLAVIDEEHDVSFKQKELAPHYNAKDVLIYSATKHNYKVLLGSATPAVDSLFNAEQNKFAYVELTERYGGFNIPQIEIVDMKKNVFKIGDHKILSHLLRQKIEETLSQKQQVIIFQNKRGFAPYFMCQDCGAVPCCNYCDVSLTYHKTKNILWCHYCNTSYNVIRECSVCKSKKIFERKFGTEQIEEIIKKEFPTYSVLRLDADSAKGKQGFEKILTQFENQEADFLIGTQMMIKGLDFKNVSLVAMVDGDSLFNFTEYRANERALQNILQVSGRAGRKNNISKVFLQMYNMNLPVLEKIKNQDYLGFYKNELIKRKELNYPPFTRLIEIVFKHKDKNTLDELTQIYFNHIYKDYKKYFLPPAEPIIGRIKNKYIISIMAKMPKNNLLIENIKINLKNTETIIYENPKWRQTDISYFVDL